METHVMGRCHVGGFVNGECVGLNPPGFAARFTRRKRCIAQASGLTAFKLRVFGFPLNATCGIFIGDVLHFARFSLNFVIEFWACKTRAITYHNSISLDIYGIG